MTAKKQSLLDKGVIIHVSWLLFSVASIEWTIFLGFWQDGGTRRLNTTRVQRLINTPKEHIFIGGGHTVTNTLWCSEFLSLSLMHIRVVGTVCADLIHAVSRVLELSAADSLHLFWTVASFEKSSILSSSPFLHCLKTDILFNVCFAKIWIFLVKMKCVISAPLVPPPVCIYSHGQKYRHPW